MARARRTRFAAPLVVVVAAGCSHKPGGGTEINGKRVQLSWTIRGAPAACLAHEADSCPDEPDIHCNPPPPIPIDCPPGAATDGTAKIVSFDGTHCVLVGPASADGSASETAIECPRFKDTSAAPPPPPPVTIDAAVAAAATPPRQWSAFRNPDGTCASLDDPCSRMHRDPGAPIPPCNPPPTRPMKTCPPSLKTSGLIVEASPGACTLQPRADCPDSTKCPVPAPVAVECPP